MGLEEQNCEVDEMIIAVNLMIIGFWVTTSDAISNPILRVIGYVTYLASTVAATIIWEKHKEGDKK